MITNTKLAEIYVDIKGRTKKLEEDLTKYMEEYKDDFVLGMCDSIE